MAQDRRRNALDACRLLEIMTLKKRRHPQIALLLLLLTRHWPSPPDSACQATSKTVSFDCNYNAIPFHISPEKSVKGKQTVSVTYLLNLALAHGLHMVFVRRNVTMKNCRIVVSILVLGVLTATGCGSDKSKSKSSSETSSTTGASTNTGSTTVNFLSFTDVAPNAASAGDTVTLTGDNFKAGATVDFGGIPSLSVTVTSATEINCVVPTGTAGAVVDVLLKSGGAVARLNNAFTYLAGGNNGGVLARVGDYGNPTGMEQELLELTNRARRNPTAEGTRLGQDFSAYPARAPLTFNAELSKAALGHTADMVKRGFYGHTNPDAVGPNGRILDTQYDLNGLYGSSTSSNLSENIGVGSGNRFNTAQDVHDTFMIDAGLVSPKHRLIMLGYGGHFPRTREVGMGFRTNQTSPGQPWEAFITEEFAFSKTDKAFVTGVVFSDNGDEICRNGEGLKGAVVTLTHSSGFTINTITADAGGYCVEILVPGTYDFTVNGVTSTITVGADNTKLDWRNGQAVTY